MRHVGKPLYCQPQYLCELVLCPAQPKVLKVAAGLNMPLSHRCCHQIVRDLYNLQFTAGQHQHFLTDPHWDEALIEQRASHLFYGRGFIESIFAKDLYNLPM